MATTPYKKMSWSPNDLITDTKLDMMVSNDDYLQANMPRARYAAFGINRTEGTKIMGGVMNLPGTPSNWRGGHAMFGNFFTSGCRPIVTVGHNSNWARHTHITFAGIGTMFPDHRGVSIAVFSNPPGKDKSLKRQHYVHWMALGY